jgi:hypothetical protein
MILITPVVDLPVDNIHHVVADPITNQSSDLADAIGFFGILQKFTLADV